MRCRYVVHLALGQLARNQGWGLALATVACGTKISYRSLVHSSSYMNMVLRIPLNASPRTGEASASATDWFRTGMQCAGAAGTADQGVEPGGAAPPELPSIARAISRDGIADGM